jgi:hypothetical protein
MLVYNVPYSTEKPGWIIMCTKVQNLVVNTESTFPQLLQNYC